MNIWLLAITPPHFGNFTHFNFGAIKIGVEQGQAIGPATLRVGFFGPDQKQYLVRHLSRRRPNFLTADPVNSCHRFGAGPDHPSIKAGIGFGHAKTAFDTAIDQRRQPCCAPFISAKDNNRMRTENIDITADAAAMPPPDSAIVCTITAASAMPSAAPP